MRYFDRKAYPFKSPEWKQWLRDCKTARDEVVKARGDKFVVKKYEHVYKAAGKFFAAIFGGKCAYCENDYEATSPVDIEHFRPKLKVTDADNRSVTLAGGQKHPGYYWLAFDWRNLLPSCEKCNRPPAKGTRFPLENGSPRTDPTGPVSREKVLLINPMEMDPEQHLDFDFNDGMVKEKNGSGRGRMSIKIYDLNREPLRLKRKEVLDKQIKYRAHALVEVREEGDWTALRREVDDIKRFWDPKQPFSALWKTKTESLVRMMEQDLAERGH